MKRTAISLSDVFFDHVNYTKEHRDIVPIAFGIVKRAISEDQDNLMGLVNLSLSNSNNDEYRAYHLCIATTNIARSNFSLMPLGLTIASTSNINDVDEECPLGYMTFEDAKGILKGLTALFDKPNGDTLGNMINMAGEYAMTVADSCIMLSSFAAFTKRIEEQI